MEQINNCIIIGAGTYGQVYEKYLSEKYNVLGFFDDNTNIIGSQINKVNVLGKINDVEEFIKNNRNVSIFVTIGNNDIRAKLQKKYIDLNYLVPSFVHKSVKLNESIIIHDPVYILPGTNIMPLTTIDRYVMISMGVNIAHHVSIKKGCFISQGTNVGASIVLSETSFLGIGSTIMTGVNRIGVGATIGAGAVIIKDVPDGATVVGNPGRILKK